MSRPSDAEYQAARQEAIRMRENDEDDQHLAKAFLNLDYRVHLLEKVLEASKHYLRGAGGREHTILVHAIEEAEAASRHLGEEPDGVLI